MHLLYLHQYFSEPKLGSGTRSYEFGRRLVADGHRVTVITGNANLKLPFVREAFIALDVAGMRVIVLNDAYSSGKETGERMSAFLRYARKAVWVAKRQDRPDVVLASSTPLTVAVPGMLLSRHFHAPMVFEVRDLWPEAPIQMGMLRNPLAIRAARMLERAAYRRAVRIIALSPGMLSGILQQGADADKLAMIPNASDNDFFTPGEPDADFLHKYGLKEQFLAVYAGNVGPSAGLEVLLGAAVLLKNISGLKWVIAGEGKDLNGLRQVVVQNGLEDKVILLGHLSKYEVANLMQSAGCALVLFKNLPVLHTNSPNKLFDALAAGKPVVSNMPGWVKDLLREYNAGLTVAPGNSHDLARAVQSIYERPETAMLMGRKARQLAEEKFDREMLYKQFAGVLQEALAQGKKGVTQGERS